MQAADASIDEIRMHYAAQESALVHGGGQRQLTPLEWLMEVEDAASEDERKAKTTEAAEILRKLLSFASDAALSAGGLTLRKRTIYRALKEGETVEYIRPGNLIPLASVTIRNSAGDTLDRWEPARLKFIRRPRADNKERNPKAVISAWEVVHESAAVRVGTRMISLAALGGIASLRELSGAGLAKKLNVTRQAVSLTNKALDNKIREATGGKSGARGLRHRADPRKGTRLDTVSK